MDALPSRGRKGLFRAHNPEKIIGDAKRVIYRSMLEFNVMRRLDADPTVVAWANEPIIIPYADHKGGARRYIPDFVIKKRRADGVVETMIVEVKPKSQSPRHSRPKSTSKKKRKTLIAEAMTLDSNQRKWAAAERFAQARGWKFVVITEQELGIK